MKKFLLVIILCLSLFVCFACSTNEVESRQDKNKSSMFVIIEKTRNYYIVYHKETKVIYAVSYGSYNCGTFTLLVDSDGKPLLYKEGV